MCEQCKHHQGQDCDCQEGCGGSSCSCGKDGCADGGHFQRRYQTKAEEIAVLETYLGELKLEIQAVEEHLADLRK